MSISDIKEARILVIKHPEGPIPDGRKRKTEKEMELSASKQIII